MSDTMANTETHSEKKKAKEKVSKLYEYSKKHIGLISLTNY
jgi:hypothetical protein